MGAFDRHHAGGHAGSCGGKRAERHAGGHEGCCAGGHARPCGGMRGRQTRETVQAALWGNAQDRGAGLAGHAGYRAGGTCGGVFQRWHRRPCGKLLGENVRSGMLEAMRDAAREAVRGPCGGTCGRQTRETMQAALWGNVRDRRAGLAGHAGYGAGRTCGGYSRDRAGGHAGSFRGNQAGRCARGHAGYGGGGACAGPSGGPCM